MQFTSKFILLAIALAYGSTAVSALPVGESSVAARSAEYEDLNVRDVDDMELFVREPFSLFGFGRPRSASSPETNASGSHTGTGLSVSSFATL